MQLNSFYSVLRFYHEKFDEIANTVDGAPLRKQADGKNKANFYLEGADDEPERARIINPAVCGYLLHSKQAKQIEVTLNYLIWKLNKSAKKLFLSRWGSQ